ncbi:hypothetical protein [Dysgonomonas macrotermitis]|uniref:Uncharacterized protein n=1 Tax=Dysgonomonas macrotermitis TaxID=1346286 RepID=A0A1M5AG68_9BACT|nr:hypothetical protein [Dysgonomonas macrotermitis]SHF29288.1 hypothetical protein SAMN05444362_10542 [Dysgonomonas macrotermitis]
MGISIRFKRRFNLPNKMYEGERIEKKVSRILTSKEPITDEAPIIHQERKMGVEAQYNIRTDRFDLAIEAMDAVSKFKTAKRDNVNKIDEPQPEGGDPNTSDN